MKEKKFVSGEYRIKGEYHKQLDPNWIYYPIYIEKMKRIDELMQNKKNFKILDAGCGEGALVVRYRKKGYDIKGFDLNYSSKYIKKGDITRIPFSNEKFDLVLCLDVLEHIEFEKQKEAIKELNRVLRKKGTLILGVPNLANFISRISFLLTGKLIRTSDIYRHKGDRPINEFIQLLKKNNFKIKKRVGLFPTFPLISILTKKIPSKVLILHKIYNFLLGYPNWCFENIIVCEKLSELKDENKKN